MSMQGLNEGQFKILEPQMEKWVNRNHYGRKVAPWRPVVNTIFWAYVRVLPGRMFHEARNLQQPMLGLE
jgi:hypothetical protein